MQKCIDHRDRGVRFLKKHSAIGRRNFPATEPGSPRPHLFGPTPVHSTSINLYELGAWHSSVALGGAVGYNPGIKLNGLNPPAARSRRSNGGPSSSEKSYSSRNLCRMSRGPPLSPFMTKNATIASGSCASTDETSTTICAAPHTQVGNLSRMYSQRRRPLLAGERVP
eukprot:2277733-Prymnesium_polylepis.1